MEDSFQQYLWAKRWIDDRALNLRVLQSFGQALKHCQHIGSSLQVLEIGAGIGTMFLRLLGAGFLEKAVYTVLDVEAQNIQTAHHLISKETQQTGWQVTEVPNRLCLEKSGCQVEVLLERCDFYEFVERSEGLLLWDVVIANAFLDLVNVPDVLRGLLKITKLDALLYATINFDGLTLFEPVIDPELDALIATAYHQTMDQRITKGSLSGGSQTGRRMFCWLKEAGWNILDAGSSDWVVFPKNGQYSDEEKCFLTYIVSTIQCALQDYPFLNSSTLQNWAEQRYSQIEMGELVYIAHQLDFLARRAIP